MEPLSQKDRKKILETNTLVTEAEIAEYQRLLSERYESRPSESDENEDARTASTKDHAPVDPKRARLAELYAKLFPEAHP